jgi:hypothetical protein
MADIIIKATKAPNLPIPTIQYSQTYAESFSNALRIYFNTLDSFTSNLSKTDGGSSLSFPHIGASDITDQYATADNTPTIVKWDTLDSGLGFTLNIDNTATAGYSGIYKIDYSLQFANTDNLAHDVDVWLRVNNVDVPRSTTKFTIGARKSAGVYTYSVAYSTVMFTLTSGDILSLYWATDKAYNTTGPVDGVFMEYQPTQTTPFNHPSIPSAIGTITFVSRT